MGQMGQMTEQRLYEVAVPLVVPSRWQPREVFEEEALLELAKSIRDQGLMYPIIVFVNEDGEHELVAGERRTRAVAALGLTRCKSWTGEHSNGLRKAIAYTAEHGWADLDEGIKQELVGTTITARIEDGGDQRRLHELAVVDNMQRENLSPLEEARALQDLVTAYGLSQRDVATQIGWSQSKVQERLALLKLAPEARQALTARAVSTSHARHLAKLPAALQPAVTAHVEGLIKKEGDQAMTVGKVAVLTRQIGTFVKPEHWCPPEGKVIAPSTRNNLRLVRLVLEQVDVGQRAEAILGLRSVGYGNENLLGKKPIDLGDRQMRQVMTALGREDQHVMYWWDTYAARRGWTCAHCQLYELEPPAGDRFGSPCRRWDDDDGNVVTCRGFVGEADPFVIVTNREVVDRMKENGADGAGRCDGLWYATDYAAWKRAVEEIAVREEKQERQAKEKRDHKYIVDLAEYWAQQQEGGLFAEVDHFQAHRCERCTHYRGELLVQVLPPCDFVLEPLSQQWNDAPRAPGFGVLVRQDGLLVPRCEHYHVSQPEIAPTAGFVLPDRGMVLEWMRRMVVGSLQHSHDNTLAHPLAWLPYVRGKCDEVHNTDCLLSYVRRMWGELGDERVATLIAVLAVECRACNSNRNPIELVDAVRLESEKWAHVGWGEAVKGEKRYAWSTWPEGWPMPWKGGKSANGK